MRRRQAGWIRIQRDLLDHPIFAPEPFTEREAFIWMIARAAHKGTTHRIGRKMVQVSRGTFMTTLREMQTEWRWNSDNRVRKFLEKLRDDGMILRKTCGKARASKTHICVCNYSEYQDAVRIKGAKEGAKTSAIEAQITPENQTENPDLDREGVALPGAQRCAVKKSDNKLPVDDDTREAPTDRERLLVAMGRNPGDLSTSGKIHGDRNDMIEARRWSGDLGLTIDEQITVIREITAKKGSPPGSFKYFTAAMQDYAGRKALPKLVAINETFPQRASGGGYERSSESTDRLHAFISGARGAP